MAIPDHGKMLEGQLLILILRFILLQYSALTPYSPTAQSLGVGSTQRVSLT